ncbi:MAG: D-glycero-beta-D-manno-heptose-7-phosphate kinase [Pseudomonadota bacterium]
MTDPTRFFDTGQRETILVVGDVMLDCYEYGAIERISPEAPVPVLRHGERSAMLGGAGNVAANLASLGAQPVLVGRIGADDTGETVRALCERDGITPKLIPDPDVPTIRKTRFVSGGQQVLRLDEEAIEPCTGDCMAGILAAIDEALPRVATVILSDYAKGLFTGGLAEAVIARAKAAGTPVIVDPKGRDFSRYRGADIVTPNRAELAVAAGEALVGEAAIIAAARYQIDTHALGALLVTRSEEGMSLVTPTDALHTEAEAREVFDVSGAGDTVVATYGLAIARGLTPASAMRLANSAAGIVVGKRGTAQVALPELRESLRRKGTIPSRMRTAATLEVARKAVEGWRREGLRIGFTNGCFDILHYGHASILERSKALCDRLVVGLNSDASVSRLKGPNRPVNPEADRAALLLALRAVDSVVVFDDDTPLALIEALLPDVLVKGADYTLDDVVGADTVQANGGVVKLLDLEPGRSTSAILARSDSPAK